MSQTQRKRKVQEILEIKGDEGRIIQTAKIQRSELTSEDTTMKKGGSLLSVGQNEVGQLGFDDNVSEKTRPALVPSNEAAANDIVDISAGGMHSLYLTKGGEVFSFGCNDEGALGRDTSEEGSEYVSARVTLPVECVRITAGDSHSAFLLKDRRVFACGSFRDSHGTMGLNVKGKQQFPVEVVPGEEFVDIKSGADHLVLLSNKGKAYTCGAAEQGQLGRVSLRSSSGETRRGKSALLQPEQVLSNKLKFVEKIWATTYGTFMQNRSNGAIYAFGLNNYSQLGVRNAKETVFTPKLTQFQDVDTITGGQHHTLVLKKNGVCYALGRKDYGRLGIGNIEEELVDTLTAVGGLSKVAQIACGECCSFAITDEGNVFAWGMGSNHQLGVGSDEDQYTPVQLTGKQVAGKKLLRVSSGGQHTLFIVEN